MERSEEEACDADCQHEEQKYRSRAPRSPFQVVSAPSKRFWSVAMQGKADHEPHGKHEPRPWAGLLHSPNVERDEPRECETFQKVWK